MYNLDTGAVGELASQNCRCLISHLIAVVTSDQTSPRKWRSVQVNLRRGKRMEIVKPVESGRK